MVLLARVIVFPTRKRQFACHGLGACKNFTGRKRHRLLRFFANLKRNRVCNGNYIPNAVFAECLGEIVSAKFKI